MKILNFGSCNVDYVYSLAHIVEEGETETTNRLDVFPGGKGLNQSIAAAKAGVQIFHAGCIGQDGEFLSELLFASGVDVSLLQTTKEKNGHAIIQVSETGENAIFLYPGSNALVTKEYIDAVLETFGEGDLLLLQNEISNVDYLVETAHRKRMRILLNPSPFNEKMERINLGKITYLVLNEVEMQALSGSPLPDAGLAHLRAQYPTLKIMLTLGENGCVYADAAQKVSHPAFAVDAVDTTAAGDTFTGYFVAGIVRGEETTEILRTASAASALAVSKKGAAPSIPAYGEVLSALHTLQVKEIFQ